ncbi:MAG TPA: glutathione S-transferase [Polyangiaceae bacterium]|nr:glutathione S-transferase [Polyangiaceae bacterium]
MSLTARPQAPIQLHRLDISGHCHRVEALLSILGLPYELVEVDFAAAAHKTPEFLAKNAFGQVPVLEDGDVILSDSNAILVYLASRYDAAGAWLPRDPVHAARVQRWLSVAAGQLAAGPVAARAVKLFRRAADLAPLHEIAHRLFAVIEAQLADTPFLAGPTATIADLAIYAYTAHADEGELSLETYPRIRAWLSRVEAIPGFVTMKRARLEALA